MQDYKQLMAREYITNKWLGEIHYEPELDLESFTGRELTTLYKYSKSFTERSKLLNRKLSPYLERSEDKKVFGAYIELCVDNKDLDVSYKKNKIQIKSHMTVNNITPTISVELLTINYLIKQDYIIEEIVGSHYYFYIKDTVYTANKYSCDCRDWLKTKQCDHVNAVNGFLLNREAVGFKRQKFE
jgi:hypothetical protein